MVNFLFIVLQYIIPQHLISRFIALLASSKNKTIKNSFISFFIKKYNINMKDALEENPYKYQSFNDFFTRALKPEVRKIVEDSRTIICPVDGEISQLGAIKSGKIFQAKGRNFNLLEFFGGEKDLHSEFEDGDFSTIYLSPKDYHRVHMPFAGTLRCMHYIPGDLFSVNPVTVNSVNNLFARNERLFCIFDTKQGAMAVTLVGAMIVAGIKIKWAEINFKKNRIIQKWEYPKSGNGSVFLRKGEEIGRFMLGSTVIICFPFKKISWGRSLAHNSSVRLGQELAIYQKLES